MPRKRNTRVTPTQEKLYNKFLADGELPTNPRTLQRLVNAMRNITYSRISELDLHNVASISLERLRASKFLNNEGEYIVIPKKAEAKDLQVASTKLRHQAAHFNKFLTARSSTLEGALEINRLQDISLFGEGNFGIPLKTLNKEQRTALWAAYTDFKDMYAVHVEAFYRFNKSFEGYKQISLIQQHLANLVLNNKEITVEMLEKIYHNFSDEEGIPFLRQVSNPVAEENLAEARRKRALRKGTSLTELSENDFLEDNKFRDNNTI